MAKTDRITARKPGSAKRETSWAQSFLRRAEALLGRKKGPREEVAEAAIRVGFGVSDMEGDAGCLVAVPDGALDRAIHSMRLTLITLDTRGRMLKGDTVYNLACLANTHARLEEALKAVEAELDQVQAARAA